MDLKSGYPWWTVRSGLLSSYPTLERDLRTEVAIIGAGITGALIADELSRHGHEVVTLEQREIAWGSTAASNALLQYEIDTHLVDLSREYGEEAAALAYRTCHEAIDSLAERASRAGPVEFARQRSLYLASRPRDAQKLQEECRLRRRHGLKVTWIASADLRGNYGIAASGALTSSQAARVDPYRFAAGLFRAVRRRGLRLHTPRGVVEAKVVIVAAGYAGQAFVPGRVARNRSTYALVTDPLEASALERLGNTMVWESARPYLYLRATPDRRFIVGGEDDRIDVPAKRDARVARKAKRLLDKASAWVPGVDLRPAFAWAGTFAETRDGLPWFGVHPATGPRMLHAMAYGGNGITFSVLGAEILRAAIERRRHPLAELFGFERRGNG